MPEKQIIQYLILSSVLLLASPCHQARKLKVYYYTTTFTWGRKTCLSSFPLSAISRPNLIITKASRHNNTGGQTIGTGLPIAKTHSIDILMRDSGRKVRMGTRLWKT